MLLREHATGDIAANPSLMPVIKESGGLGKFRDSDRAGNPTGMTMTRTTIGLDVAEALGEVLAHLTGAVAPPSRIVDVLAHV